VRTKNEIVPVTALGEPERVKAMGVDGKRKRKGKRKGLVNQDDDDSEPLNSHEKRAKSAAAQQQIEA